MSKNESVIIRATPEEKAIWEQKQKLKAILNAGYKSISSIESDEDLVPAPVKSSILVNPKYLANVENITGTG